MLQSLTGFSVQTHERLLLRLLIVNGFFAVQRLVMSFVYAVRSIDSYWFVSAKESSVTVLKVAFQNRELS